MDRDDTAAILGLPPERVRIIPSAVGGGFGGKLDLSLQPLLGLVALQDRPPGAHDLHPPRKHGLHAPSATRRGCAARIGCDADGRLTALEFEGVFDTGAYASWGPTVANRVPVHATGPYRVPHVAAPAPARSTPTARSPAPSAASACRRRAIAQETLDRPARRRGRHRPAGVPPPERAPRRRRHRHRPDAAGRRHRRLPRRAAPALARAPWPTPQRQPRQPRRRRRLPAGTAAATPRCRTPRPSASASAPTATLVLHQGATDIGQGSNTVIAQIAADALGLPRRRLHA